MARDLRTMDESEPPEPGFGAGLIVGTLGTLAALALVSSWRRRADEDAFDPRSYTWRRAPEGCLIVSRRPLVVRPQTESFVPPATLGAPELLPPGETLTVLGVMPRQGGFPCGFRCDVGREGDPRLLAAWLTPRDFHGLDRRWFEAALASAR